MFNLTEQITFFSKQRNRKWEHQGLSHSSNDKSKVTWSGLVRGSKSSNWTFSGVFSHILSSSANNVIAWSKERNVSFKLNKLWKWSTHQCYDSSFYVLIFCFILKFYPHASRRHLFFLSLLVFAFQLCLIKLAFYSPIQPPVCCTHLGPHLV